METEIETGDNVNERGRTGNRQLIDISLKEVNCIVAVVVSFSLLLLSPMTTWASIDSMAFECGTHTHKVRHKTKNNPVGLSVHYEFSVDFNFIDKKNLHSLVIWLPAAHTICVGLVQHIIVC